MIDSPAAIPYQKKRFLTILKKAVVLPAEDLKPAIEGADVAVKDFNLLFKQDGVFLEGELRVTIFPSKQINWLAYTVPVRPALLSATGIQVSPSIEALNFYPLDQGTFNLQILLGLEIMQSFPTKTSPALLQLPFDVEHTLNLHPHDPPMGELLAYDLRWVGMEGSCHLKQIMVKGWLEMDAAFLSPLPSQEGQQLYLVTKRWLHAFGGSKPEARPVDLINYGSHLEKSDLEVINPFKLQLQASGAAYLGIKNQILLPEQPAPPATIQKRQAPQAKSLVSFKYHSSLRRPQPGKSIGSKS